MERERSAEQSFNRRADRDAHELPQMPVDDRERIEAIRRAGEQEKAALSKDHARRWSRDIDAATHDILREHDAQRLQRPWWHLRSPRPTAQEVAALAIQRVEERNRATLMAVDQLTQRNEKQVRDAWRVRDGKPEKERVAMAAMRDQLKRDREATRDHERER